MSPEHEYRETVDTILAGMQALPHLRDGFIFQLHAVHGAASRAGLVPYRADEPETPPGDTP
jgi:hypothetical protein